MMKAFALIQECDPVRRENEHGGRGPIEFRRLLTSDEFESRIDFVDFTIIPPGSVIGRHAHNGNEELYLIKRGTATVRVDNEQRRVTEGDVTIVRSHQYHELVNDSAEPVEIFVVQVSLEK